MTAQDVESKIKFRQTPGSCGGTRITAILHLEVHYELGEITLAVAAADSIRFAERKAREELMRSIYEDQRKEFYEALMGCLSASPMDRDEQREAHNRLLNAAKRQPHGLPVIAEDATAPP